MEVKTLFCGIDPGPQSFAWTVWDGSTVTAHGEMTNADAIERDFAQWPAEMRASYFAIESIVAYGATVGTDTFATAETIGVLRVRLRTQLVFRLTRPEIKLHFLGRRTGTDSDLRNAVRAQFDVPPTKQMPPELNGIKSHNLAAFYAAYVLQQQMSGDFGYSKHPAEALKGYCDGR